MIWISKKLFFISQPKIKISKQNPLQNPKNYQIPNKKFLEPTKKRKEWVELMILIHFLRTLDKREKELTIFTFQITLNLVLKNHFLLYKGIVKDLRWFWVWVGGWIGEKKGVEWKMWIRYWKVYRRLGWNFHIPGEFQSRKVQYPDQNTIKEVQ